MSAILCTVPPEGANAKTACSQSEQKPGGEDWLWLPGRVTRIVIPGKHAENGTVRIEAMSPWEDQTVMVGGKATPLTPGAWTHFEAPLDSNGRARIDVAIVSSPRLHERGQDDRRLGAAIRRIEFQGKAS